MVAPQANGNIALGEDADSAILAPRSINSLSSLRGSKQSASRAFTACRRAILAVRIPTSARQASGRLGTGISAIPSILRSPKWKPRTIWRAICKRRWRRPCATARFWPRNQKCGLPRSSTSHSTSVPGGCRRRPCGEESISGIGLLPRTSCDGGFAVRARFCPDWSAAAKQKLYYCSGMLEVLAMPDSGRRVETLQGLSIRQFAYQLACWPQSLQADF